MQKSHIETILDFDRLMAAADKDAETYKNAASFPHITLEGFLPDSVYREALAEYPSPEQVMDWRRVEALDDKGRIAQNLKLGYSNEQRLGPVLRDLIDSLCNSKISKPHLGTGYTKNEIMR